MSDDSNQRWTSPGRRASGSRVIHLSDGSAAKELSPDERVAWETRSWRNSPASYQMFSPPRDKPWLSPRKRIGSGDFSMSTTTQKLFRRAILLPGFTIIFILADLLLLFLLLRYLLG